MYTFTKELETGNSLIDSQHRQLFDAINNLLSSCSYGKGRDEIHKTIKFLYDYTAKHFSDEEKLQVKYGYPDYKNHRQYHEGFKKVIKDLSEQLDKEGPTIALVGKVNTNIGGWLVTHIKREDTKVASHIKSKNA